MAVAISYPGRQFRRPELMGDAGMKHDSRSVGEQDGGEIYAVGRDRYGDRYQYSKSEMIKENAGDKAFLEWLDDAGVGDFYDDGNGERVDRIA